MAAASSLAGALAGGGLALAGAAVAAGRLPVQPDLLALAAPLALAFGFGLLTAITFALPALGRALSVSPAASPAASWNWAGTMPRSLPRPPIRR